MVPMPPYRGLQDASLGWHHHNSRVFTRAFCSAKSSVLRVQDPTACVGESPWVHIASKYGWAQLVRPILSSSFDRGYWPRSAEVIYTGPPPLRHVRTHGLIPAVFVSLLSFFFFGVVPKRSTNTESGARTA